ncbi:MAG: type I-B CRISPR-associated protein Cas5b, partial [Bacillota bacterium]
IAGIDNGAGEGADGAAYWGMLNGTQVAVAVRSPLSWYLTAVNLLKFKSKSGDMKEHIQPKHQFIKNPRYRIYVRGGQIYGELKARLSRNESVFTPYLGVAYAIAEVDYLGEFSDEDVLEFPAIINTVVPVVDDMVIDITKSQAIFKELVPLALDEGRNFLKSVPVIYSGQEGTGKIFIKEKGYLSLSKVGADGVAWFEPW